jgi:hypothetical protein
MTLSTLPETLPETLQETLDSLLSSYNVKTKVSIANAEIKIALNMPSHSTINLPIVRKLILEHLPTSTLNQFSVVKIFNSEALEPDVLFLEPLNQQDIIHEIFRIPNQCLLSPAEIQQLILGDRFLLE